MLMTEWGRKEMHSINQHTTTTRCQVQGKLVELTNQRTLVDSGVPYQ
jgi:hypothetical protein